MLNKNEKILLMLLPFWAPLNPPLGISCLKSALKEEGYKVKTIDANVETELWEMHRTYLDTLQRFIPESKQGNFYMVGYDVFMNHLMADINYDTDERYTQLIKILIQSNFFVELPDDQVEELKNVVKEFYRRFRQYLMVLLLKERPSIVGLTVYGVTLAPSLFACKLIKKTLPHIKTLIGGGIFADQLAVTSVNFQQLVQRTPYIDKIFVGEGENLFLKYLRRELPEDQKVYTLRDIDYHLMDLSSVKLPDFSDLEAQNYTMMASFASRSCPYQCSFCSETVQWGKYRKKDATQVADELISLYNTYHQRIFILGDSLVNPIVADLAREMIERGQPVFWDGYLRADEPVCDPENTALWRRGGFYRARLGIESGSPHVLELMNKKITPEQIKAAIASLAQAGIKTTTYWVIGHPGETEEDFQQTLDLITECKDNIYETDYHPFYYFPTGQVNSAVWEQERGSTPLYPEEYLDMLMVQTWNLNCEPSREVVYDRVCRFEQHIKKLGIPNPYSLHDIFLADQRWSALHENAVPPLMGLQLSEDSI